jgi:hypothetical protein
MFKETRIVLILITIIIGCSQLSDDKNLQKNNVLSQAEINEGWQLLFDGESTDGN